MLMWLTGFLVVPTAQRWSGVVFLLLALGLLALWGAAFRRTPAETRKRNAGQLWVEALALEEAVIGGVTAPLAGVQQAWDLIFGVNVPQWAPWLACGAGLYLLALAHLRYFVGEWLLPVRGRWRRMSLAGLGMGCLYLAGPCWIFLIQLWRLQELGADGALLVAARVATVLLAGVVVLYSTAFVLRLGRRAVSTESAHQASMAPHAG